MKKKAKISKKLLAGLLAAVLLMLHSISAFAMGFDFDEVSKSVFMIVATDERQTYTSIGTGFAVDDTHIVTNAHVVADSAAIAIGSYSETAKDNIGNVFLAKLVSIDEAVDIAVLKVEDVTLTPLKMADANTIKEGDDVYAIGTPEGLPYTLTRGTVSSKLRVIEGVNYVQTDAGITHGNSGGPLLNDNGEVIGINTSGSSTSESIRFAIRVDTVVDYLDKNIYNTPVQNSGNAAGSTSGSSGTENGTSGSTGSDLIGDGGSGNDYVYVYVPIGAIAFLALVIVGIVIGMSGTSKKRKARSEFSVPVLGEMPEDTANEAVGMEKEIPVAAPAPVMEEPLPVEQAQTWHTTAGVRILNGSMAGAQVEIEPGQTLKVGKDSRLSNLVVERSYMMVSRMHCTITYSAEFDKYYVIDCSSNGTYMENGERLVKSTRTPLARGTVLELADSSCKLMLI